MGWEKKVEQSIVLTAMTWVPLWKVILADTSDPYTGVEGTTASVRANLTI